MSQESENNLIKEKNFLSNPSPTIKYPKDLFSPVNTKYNSLQQCRIIQKHLVYIIGLSTNLIKKESELKNFEYFGQYGKIIKLVINKNKIYNSNGPNGPSYSCYVTYSNYKESSLCILSLDNSIIDKHIIKASYGTTKYCLNFLRNSICLNKDCLYLHYIANKDDIVSRDEMNNNKNIFANQIFLAIQLSQIEKESVKKELCGIKDVKTFFPNAFNVYNKDIVIDYLQKHKFHDYDNDNNNNIYFNNDVCCKDNCYCDNGNNRNIDNDNSNNNDYNEKFICLNYVDKENNNDNENNIIKNNNDNDNNNNKLVESTKTYLSINNLNKIFLSKDKSRFSFANDKLENNINSLNKIDVPISIQKFISENLNYSISQKEKNDIIDYYFSHSYDKWDYLISTLKMWKEFENYPKGNCHKDMENENYILLDKFNTN